jgi:subtilisin-like proprotein convertase family protein
MQMLEANLELTWRDVQQILARTAQVKNDGSDPSFATNQAGFTHSSRYGFGIVNANEAVTMSETWVNIGPEASHVREGRGAVQIPDNRNNSTKLSLVFDIGVNKFITETVYLYVKVNHSSRGHLKIDLISPSGMLSTMSPGQRPEAQQSGWMKFTSVRYWNEDPNGEWIISIVDTIPGTVNDCIDYNDYRFPFFEETEDANLEISCAPKHIGTLAQFCFNGTLDPNGYQATLCNETGTGDEAACSRLERFESKAYNDRTGPEACCLCGGGFSPEELPETIVEWKVVVYGRDQSTGEGFFSDSGIGNDFQLNKWGGCGNRPRGRPLLDLEYLDPEQLEALSRIHDEIGGVRGRQ